MPTRPTMQTSAPAISGSAGFHGGSLAWRYLEVDTSKSERYPGLPSRFVLIRNDYSSVCRGASRDLAGPRIESLALDILCTRVGNVGTLVYEVSLRVDGVSGGGLDVKVLRQLFALDISKVAGKNARSDLQHLLEASWIVGKQSTAQGITHREKTRSP